MNRQGGIRWGASRGFVFALFALCGGLCGCKLEAPGPEEVEAGPYRLIRDSGVHWFEGASGGRFVSIGMNYVDPVFLTSTSNRDLFLQKYGGDLMDAEGKPNCDGEAAAAFMDDAAGMLLGWGFNSLGVHNPIPQRKMPYVARFRPASLESWPGYRARYVDPFDPEVEEFIRERARQWCDQHRGDRLVLGVAFNEKTDWSTAPGEVHPWVRFLTRRESTSPGKRRFVEHLEGRYDSASQAGKVWGIQARTWDDFLERKKWPYPQRRIQAANDSRDFLPAIAEAWYALESSAIRTCDHPPLVFGDKLLGGARMPTWLDPILGRHFDLVFVEWNARAPNILPRLRQLHRGSGRPVLLGNSGFAVATKAQPNPKGVRVISREAVGTEYETFLSAVMKEPYVVGWHYSGFIEGSRDLERVDSAFARQPGLLDPMGKPYDSVVSRVAKANRRAVEEHEEAKALEGQEVWISPKTVHRQSGDVLLRRRYESD